MEQGNLIILLNGHVVYDEVFNVVKVGLEFAVEINEEIIIKVPKETKALIKLHVGGFILPLVEHYYKFGCDICLSKQIMKIDFSPLSNGMFK